MARGTLVEGVHQSHPVDRVDHVGIAGDRGRLVGLQLADEMPAKTTDTRLAAGSCLRGGFLVTVLAHVAHSELGQQPDITGRERLGDRHDGHLAGVAPGALAGRGDALLQLGPAAGQLVAADSLDIRFAHAGSQTRPAKRPLTPSRRWE